MKKTNVMIDVSDDIYSSIVEPYKKRKSFGNLVVMLLEAYAYNESIYNYVNGVMDGLEDQATEELIKDLNSMADSLSMFSALSDQAESVLDNGMREFEKFGSKAQEDLDKGIPVPSSQSLTRDDVVSIVNDSMSDIRDMLKQVLAGGVQVAQPVSPVITQDRVADEIVSTIIKPDISYGREVVDQEVPSATLVDEVMDRVEESIVTSIVEEPSDISSADEEFAANALSSLMGSLGW